MIYLYTRSLTTHSCIYTVVTPIRRQLLLGWNDASQTSDHWMSANRLKVNTDKTELLWVGSRHCFPSKTVVLQFYNSVLTP